MAELLFVIDTELELLKMRMHGILSAVRPKSAKKFRWTGKATDLVELLYALDTCDCINNGEIGVEELADVLSEIFDVEIKNCYNVYMNMKRRKDDSRTYFLDELREKLNKRMMESDLKGGKSKKRKMEKKDTLVRSISFELLLQLFPQIFLKCRLANESVSKKTQ